MGGVPEDFVIARNPEVESTLPYLIRIPLGPQGIVLKARETWPRTAKVYCHRADEWPEDAEVVQRVPSHERYARRFSGQQARTERRALPAGDYAVEVDDRFVAAVERKSLTDLVSTLTSGRLRYVLAELAALDHAAVLVEDRYSKILDLQHVRPAVVLDGLGECQARFPTVPVIFAETRALAQEWTFRFFGAALARGEDESAAERRFGDLVEAGPLAEAAPTTAQVRGWARENGIPVPDRGRLRPEVWAAYSDR